MVCQDDLKILVLDFVLHIRFPFTSTSAMQGPGIDIFRDINTSYTATLTSRSHKTLGRVDMYISECHENSKRGQIISGMRNPEWFYKGGEI